MIAISLQSSLGETLASVRSEGTIACLRFDRVYQPGDVLVFETDCPYLYASADEAHSAAHLYIPEGKFVFPIPVEGDLPDIYSPIAFKGEHHLCFAVQEPEAKGECRNLALNPLCPHNFSGAYPFVSANVETRNESVFYARNVIDGVLTNHSHGIWPYQSWGIGLSETAEIAIDFGREVTVNRMALLLRADFPHDAYWKQATVTLSDGTEKTFPLELSDQMQYVTFDQPVTITGAKLSSLIKQVMDSPFPALKQWVFEGIG